jgi:hypothetical protein
MVEAKSGQLKSWIGSAHGARAYWAVPVQLHRQPRTGRGRSRRAYEEEARARYDAQVRARNEERRQLRALFRDASRLQRANRLGEFIAAVEDRAAHFGDRDRSIRDRDRRVRDRDRGSPSGWVARLAV